MRIKTYELMLEGQTPVLECVRSSNYTNTFRCSPQFYMELANDVYKLNRRAEEYVIVIGTNTAGRPIGCFEVSHGTVNQSCLSPREIMIRMLLCGASRIVILHNHPSGCVDPSSEDLRCTKNLKEVGKMMDIPIIDHIIVGSKKEDGTSLYYSFVENHLLGND